MSTTVSMWLGIAFLGLCIAAVLLQAWLWGPQFWDEEAKKTRAPKFWLRVHALCGYAYGIIYVIMMWNMLPRLWEYQYELPARTVLHAVFGITIGVLLICKIAILLFFRHFEESMPFYGFGLLVCTVVLSTLSVPYALQAHDLSGRTTDPENVQRVQELLARVDFGDEEVNVEAITTIDGFDAGRETLVRKCVVCHDMRTILAKPRTAQKWYDVSYRMLDKPSVFGKPLLAEEIPAVTAYLTAVTPEIQESTKKKRKQERKAQEATETVVSAIADSAGDDVDRIPDEEGKQLLDTHCTDCHELDDIYDYGGADIAGWRSVVAAMVEEGAEYDQETTEQLVAYLAQAYPPGTPKATPAKTEEETKADEAEAKAQAEAEAEVEAEDEGRGEAEDEDEAEDEAEAEAEEVVEMADDEPKPKPKKTKPKKPKKPKYKPNVANGSQLYMKKCKTCHGAGGDGNTKFGKKLDLASIKRTSRSKIKRAIIRGVPGTKMRAFGGKLTKQEIEDLTAFTHGL